jgi:putative peptide zinc metalloprotease protein
VPHASEPPLLVGPPPRPADGEPDVPARPALAPGVELVGELEGSGFVDSQWLVQRNGRFIQLTELLYRILELADGERTLEEIAAGVTDATDWLVEADDVRRLIVANLLPAGLVEGTVSDAAQPARPDAISPLTLKARVRAIGPNTIEPVARVLQYLFVPPVVLVALAVIVAAHAWLYTVRGLTGAVIDALYTPSSLLVVVGVVLLGAVVHEFGHASALRYGGGRARGMGAGFYLVFPAFYTDVTESYRLGRWARVRTGLGGVYFHLLFAVAIIGSALVFELEFLLLAVVLINFEVLRQFVPFVRLDGYWVLADLTGIPDFFSHMRPFLRNVVARLRGEPRPGTRLKPWVERVFATYIVITIPLLVALLVLFVRVLPRFATAVWDAILTQVTFASDAFRADDAIASATAISQLLLLALPVLAIAYLIYTLTWKPLRAVLHARNPRLRLVGVLTLVPLLVGIALLWAPSLPFADAAPPAGVRNFDVTQRTHVSTPLTYPQTPPVGGNHAPVWQNCGFYPIPVPSEHAVHSLEHGAVWITYEPQLPRAQVETLRELANETYVLVSPYRGLRDAVVVSAWGRQLRLGSASDSRLERFVRAFRLDERAPESGGPCTGGTGNPR